MNNIINFEEKKKNRDLVNNIPSIFVEIPLTYEEVVILTEELEYAFCGMCEEIEIMATEKVLERKKFNDIDEIGIEVDNMIDKINMYDDKLMVFPNILEDIGFLPFFLEDDMYMLSLHIYELEYLLSALEIASDIAVCEGDNQRALILDKLFNNILCKKNQYKRDIHDFSKKCTIEEKMEILHKIFHEDWLQV